LKLAMAADLSSVLRRVTAAVLHSPAPLLLPVLILLPALGGFPYPSAEAAYSDLTISHYPNAIFLRRSLAQGEIPLWSPAILGGAPFAANPLSSLWYPPAWLALVLPLPFAFNLLVVLHLLWGSWGLYRLLRPAGLGHIPALFAGTAFAALPKLYAHYGAGHLTLLYAVPWTPWLLLASMRGVRYGAGTGAGSPAAPVPAGGRTRMAAFYRQTLPRLLFRPGVILALIFLADVRWAAFAGLLWLAHSLYNRRKLVDILLETVLAALLSAPLAVPLLEYSALSTRSQMSAADVLAYSLPPADLLGLFFPAAGFHEWVVYPGGVVLLLALAGLGERSVRRAARFWWAVILVSLVFSLGSALPGMEGLARLPGINLLRVPARALFITGLALAVCAAYSLQRLSSPLAPPARRRLYRLLLLPPAFALAFSLGIWLLTGELPGAFAWGSAVLAAGAVWIAAGPTGRMARPFWAAGLLLLLLLDLSLYNRMLFSSHAPEQVLAGGRPAAEYLSAQPGIFRVYSPSFSMPQHTAALYGLELAGGVDPLQPAAYAAFMEKASGIPAGGYSVTLPPFTSTEPEPSGEGYEPDTGLLGLLNVGYVLAEYDLQAPGLELLEVSGSTRLYANQLVRPRAWVQPLDAGPLNAPETGRVEVLSRSANRLTLAVEVDAVTPQRLVLSETAFPGWQARVDGRPVEIETFNGLLRSLVLEPGAHSVVFTYWPRSVYAGLALGAAGVVLLLASGLLNRGERARILQAADSERVQHFNDRPVNSTEQR